MPEMPLVFGAGAEGARYNLRKLGELTYHLARAARTEDLFSHCLFNYDWMYAKVGTYSVDLTNVHEDFTTTEKAPTRAFSWLKVPTSAFTFKTLLRHMLNKC